MKRYLLLLLVIFILTGCSSNEQVMHCKRTASVKDLKMDYDYKITYIDDEVISLEINEVIEGKESTLESLKAATQKRYDKLKDLNYFDASVEIENGKLINESKIDYSKIDKDRLIEIDSAYKNYYKEDKAYLENFKQEYYKLGLTCE